MATKIYFHYLEEAVFNSLVLYRKMGGPKRFLDFKLDVVREMMNRSGKRWEDIPEKKGMHFSRIIPTPPGNSQYRRRCVLCLREGKRKNVAYECKRCKEALCPAPCFEFYHIEKTRHQEEEE